MPLYEYECQQCHRRTEKIQKFSDSELTICPFCGGALERTLTAPAIQFKGSGWYKDLYSSAKPATSGGGGEGSAAGDGSPDKKTPTAKSETAPTAGSTPASGSAPSAAPDSGSGSASSNK